MIRKRNSFFTFIFSLIPGAGEMYMGFMKRGISTMSIFFFVVFTATWLGLGPLLFVMPVIWFYSFFSVHNLRAMPDDEFYAFEDGFLFDMELNKDKISQITKKYNMIIAVTLIVIGFSILWNNLIDTLRYRFNLPEPLRSLIYSFGNIFPQSVIAVGIIILGIYLIKGKKNELDYPMLEDKGGNAE